MKREDYITTLRLLLSLFQTTIENKHDTWRQTYYNLQESIRSFLPIAWDDGESEGFNDTGQDYLERIEEHYLRNEWPQMVKLCREWTMIIVLLED